MASTGEGREAAVRIVIADDSAVMRETLALAMSGQGVEVVGTAEDAASLERTVRETAPSVVLLDLRLGDSWGFDLVPGLRAQPSSPQVIVLSAMVDERTRAEADRSGAWCQLAKGCPLEDIRDAVVAASGGTTV